MTTIYYNIHFLTIRINILTQFHIPEIFWNMYIRVTHLLQFC